MSRESGDGDGPGVIEFDIHPAKFSDPRMRAQSDGVLFWKITTGEKPMPAYGTCLIFKGSGFYTTDYRSQSYKEAAKKESAPKAAETGDKSAASKEAAKSSSPPQTKTPEKGSAKESSG
jgi:hypothetical protein